jgi:hypothetical protein
MPRPRDAMFAQRMKDQQARLQELTAQIDVLEGQMQRGQKRITPEAVERFGQVMREKSSGKDPAFCKGMVSLLVDRVAVSNDIMSAVRPLHSTMLCQSRTSAPKG